MTIVETGHYPCIYQIRNLINGKVYVGSTKNYADRCAQHKSKLLRNIHGTAHLQAAFNKYGKDNFVIEPLEITEEQNLIKREQYWIDTMRPFETGYNVRTVAESCAGIKQTRESIERRSATRRRLHIIPWNKGIKLPKEMADKIRAAIKRNPPNLGKPMTQEQKDKISKTRLERGCGRGEKAYNFGQGIPILQYDLNMNLIRRFDNAHRVQDETGFYQSNIRHCCIGDTKTSYGFIWRYENVT